MNDILNMMVLGLVAGLLSVLWTRVIKRGMIFYPMERWLIKKNNNHVMRTNKDSPWVSFAICLFCITPWLCLVMEVFYIVDQVPYWPYAIIGVLGGLGSGNFIAEVVNSLRNEG